ncbi:MAG: GNAT family N-acetyltransferase [Chthoniobacterales bacterium]
MFTILPCITTSERRLFERLPEILQKKDPHYVPPFPGSTVKILDPKSAFHRKHGRIYPFLAWRDGKPCGRIAAIINRSHNAHYKDRTGFFGFFDAENDTELANVLFAQVEEILRKEGCDSIRGPYHPSIHDECGLLTAGFDTPPMIFMPHNAAYYEALVLGVGFSQWHELYAFVCDLAQGVPDRIEKVTSRLGRIPGLRIRDMDLKNMDSEIALICRLYNLTLDANKGYYPIALEDLQEAAEGLKAFADPRLITFAEIEGEPVAFSMALPNLNEYLLKAKPRTGIFRFLEVVWKIKTRHPLANRLAVLGVLPGHRDKGLGALLYSECLRRGFAGGYRQTEVSWIDKDNRDILRAIHAMHCRQTKTYRIYEKRLADG